MIIDVLFSEFIEHCAQHPTQHVVLILKKHTSKKNLTLLGLRGGISIALALSLKPEMSKDLWVATTYFIVAFSILVQGLSVGKVAKKLIS